MSENQIGFGALHDTSDELIKNSDFNQEYDTHESEIAVIRAMVDARKASGLTQKDLSEKTGIAQGDISKLENGNANPSLKTLQRLAEGMGMKLKLELIPANR